MTVPASPPGYLTHLSRDRFSPGPGLAAITPGHGLARITSPFGPAWLATRYEDVRAVLGNSAAFSTGQLARLQQRQAADAGTEIPEPDSSGILVTYDPPEHTRLRRMLTPEFTIRRMQHLEPRVTEIITDRLDAMAAAGPPADLVESFALPVPSLVICELLGVPYSDREEFQRRAKVQLDFAASPGARAGAAAQMREYMNELVAGKLADPGDDLPGMLIREHGAELTRSELAGIAQLLLLAGHETTANMLATGTLVLLENPGQLAVMRDDPDAVNNAVEELLRYLSVVHSGLPRTVVSGVTIAGQALAPGELIFCSLPMANRSSGLAADADHLDLTREPSPHVAFGHGIHHCLGAPLARVEMRIGFPALLRRFPALRLAVPSGAVEFRRLTAVHGVRSLPVTW
jgi:cytochrome P450